MFTTRQVKKVKTSKNEVDKILKNAFDRDLNLDEINKLLFSDPKSWNDIIKTADEVKEKFFGKKIHLYVPVYIDSYCINDCLYCDFRRSNSQCLRKRLTFDEFQKEIAYLFKRGYTKIELVSSTDPDLLLRD